MTDHKDARQLLADITAGLSHIRVVSIEMQNAIADIVAEQDKRIAELEAERQWQPIETAPKDGTKMLAACFKTAPDHKGLYGHTAVDSWEEKYGGFGRFNNSYWPATHWMPLPASPEGTQS